MSSLSPHLTRHVSTPTRREERPAASSLRGRLRVLLHRGALDRELAEGADADIREDLALRAAQLTAPGHRRTLADSLDEAVAIAEGQGPRITSSPPLASRDVRAARAALLSLSRELREPGAVRAQGVAIAQRLLTDGTGPLYVESRDDDALWQLARRASLALRTTS